MLIQKVFSFRELVPLSAAVIVNRRGLCSQVDFMCVLIAHLSWHIVFGSFSHCWNMNNPQKPHQKGSLTVNWLSSQLKVIFELVTSQSNGQDEGLPFSPDVRSREIECFAWGYAVNVLCSWGILLIARAVSEMKDHPAASLKGFCCGLTVWHTRGILQGAEGEAVTLADSAADLLWNSVYTCGDFSPAHFWAPD